MTLEPDQVQDLDYLRTKRGLLKILDVTDSRVMYRKSLKIQTQTSEGFLNLSELRTNPEYLNGLEIYQQIRDAWLNHIIDEIETH